MLPSIFNSNNQTDCVPPGGTNEKPIPARLTTIPDASRRTLSLSINTEQVSYYTGASVLLDDLPRAQCMLADLGYDADW